MVGSTDGPFKKTSPRGTLARGPSRLFLLTVRVLLLGATGFVGQRTAAELLRQPEVEELWVSGRNEGRVAELARLFDNNTGRVHPLPVDLTEKPVLQVGGRAADVVVSCAGPAYETEVPAVRAAIDAGSSYVSLGDDHGALQTIRQLDGDARSAGVTVVSGCGVSPGITNMLVAHAAPEPESVAAIDIALARSSAESEGEASARHFLYELSQGAPVIRDGRQQMKRAGSSPKLVFFPEPVGWIETFHGGHPEMATLPDLYPNLTSLEFRLGLAERITMDTARAFTATPLSRMERGRRLFVTLTRPARPLIDRLPPRGPAWTAARVDVRKRDAEGDASISLGVADRLINFASVPLTLAALRLGRKEVSGTGVLPAERAFEVKSFLNDLVRRGVGIAQLEASPV